MYVCVGRGRVLRPLYIMCAIKCDRVCRKLIKFHIRPLSCCILLITFNHIKSRRTNHWFLENWKMRLKSTYEHIGIYISLPSGDMQVSTYPGRIIVTEPKGLVQPRINVEKHSLRHVVLNGQTTLPCIAQGHPVPTYR